MCNVNSFFHASQLSYNKNYVFLLSAKAPLYGAKAPLYGVKGVQSVN